MHEHIKKYFLMCAIKIAASHGAPLVSPDDTSIHFVPQWSVATTSPRTFPQPEKFFVERH